MLQSACMNTHSYAAVLHTAYTRLRRNFWSVCVKYIKKKYSAGSGKMHINTSGCIFVIYFRFRFFFLLFLLFHIILSKRLWISLFLGFVVVELPWSVVVVLLSVMSISSLWGLKTKSDFKVWCVCVWLNRSWK